jgi:hypothetical protein
MPPSATSSSAMNVVMPVNPGDPLMAESIDASAGNREDEILGFITYEMIKCASLYRNPVCTPEKLIALAAQCKNQVYVQTMKKRKGQHDMVTERLGGATQKFEGKVGTRLTALLKAHIPVRTPFGCTVGKKRVRTTDSVSVLIAFAKLHAWKAKQNGNVHEMTKQFSRRLRAIEGN